MKDDSDAFSGKLLRQCCDAADNATPVLGSALAPRRGVVGRSPRERLRNVREFSPNFGKCHAFAATKMSFAQSRRQAQRQFPPFDKRLRGLACAEQVAGDDSIKPVACKGAAKRRCLSHSSCIQGGVRVPLQS